jgi:PPOX class probable F420-dependent enzyme
MAAADPFVSLHGHKYLNVETFRKNGQGVRTPVWFAEDPNAPPSAPKLYIYSTADSGKVKRIRNSSHVRIAPCDMRGKLLGDWLDARAQIVNGQEAEYGMKLLNKKYRPWKQLLDFFALFSRHKRVVIAITPA